MNRANIKSSNIPYLFSGVLFFVSIIFLIIAIVMGGNAIRTKANSDAYTMATRVEISSHWSHDSNGSGKTMMYSPVFFYNVNNKEYSCSRGTFSSAKPNILNNKVYYNSQNPEYCISHYDFIKDIFIACIFLVVSIPELVIGIFIFITAIGQSRINRELAEKGQLIKDIPCTIIPSNTKLDDSRGYIVELEYQGQIFKSDIKFGIDIRRNTADLLIDPLNSKHYFIGFDIT